MRSSRADRGSLGASPYSVFPCGNRIPFLFPPIRDPSTILVSYHVIPVPRSGFGSEVPGTRNHGSFPFRGDLPCVWLESGGSGAEPLRSRGCLDGERRERSGSRRYIRSRCGFAPSLEIRRTEPLRSCFSSPSPSRLPPVSPLSARVGYCGGGGRAQAAAAELEPASSRP
jgi:hypothetical protein